MTHLHLNSFRYSLGWLSERVTESYGSSVKSFIKFNGIFKTLDGLKKGKLNKDEQDKP